MIIVRGISFYVNFTPIGRLNCARRERLAAQIEAACEKGEAAIDTYWASEPFDSEDPRRHLRREVQNLMATLKEAESYWTPVGAIRLIITNLEKAASSLTVAS